MTPVHMLLLSFAGCAFTLVMGSFLGYHIYLVLCVLFPSPSILDTNHLTSPTHSSGARVARIKRRSNTSRPTTSYDISPHCPPAASQVRLWNIN
jgi:hypothetical protein